MPPLQPSSKRLGSTHQQDLSVHAYQCRSVVENKEQNTRSCAGNHVYKERSITCDAVDVENLIINKVNPHWESAIISHVRNGVPGHALTLYSQMPDVDSNNLTGCGFVALLTSCIMLQDLKSGYRLHTEIARRGHLEDVSVGSCLVDMYAKCGLLVIAQEVLHTFPIRNVVSWTVLIAGYVEHGLLDEALSCIEQMQLEGISPNEFTFVCTVKACGSAYAGEKGQEMHVEIVKRGFLKANVFLGSALIYMYMRCGFLIEAQQVFDTLDVHNVVSWNTLVAGLIDHGYGEEALHYLEQMAEKGIPFSIVTFTYSLKACASLGCLRMGEELHVEIVKKGLESELMIGNTLIDLYVKTAALIEAQDVFSKLSVRDIVSWTALTVGYAEYGQENEVLAHLESPHRQDIAMNDVAYVCNLKASGSIGSTSLTRGLHVEVIKKGLEGESMVGNTLVDTYANLGFFEDARDVFNKLPNQTVISCNALMTGYAEHGHGREAHELIEQMHCQGIAPDEVTFLCSLRLCDNTLGLHSEIIHKGLEKDVLIGNVLLVAYGQCGLLAEAQAVFHKLHVRTVSSWTALMTGLTEHGFGEKAFELLERMVKEGIAINMVTLVCLLKACSTTGANKRGQRMHVEIAMKGFEREFVVASALVDMYCKCGLLPEAHGVLHGMDVHDAVVWNALITGYAEQGHDEEVLGLLKEMQDIGVLPDTVTLLLGLKACGTTEAGRMGQELHAEIVQRGWERDGNLANGLLEMYVKHGSLIEAHEVFNALLVADAASWNMLILGYIEHGNADEALVAFDQMQREGLPQNSITYIYGLKACTSRGFLHKGIETHCKTCKQGLEGEVLVGHVLVDMYATFGLLAEAEAVFSKLSIHKLSAWNTLLAGLAQLGDCKRMFSMLDRMMAGGIQPNLVTFVSILNACSHGGFVDEGLIFVKDFLMNCEVMLALEHCNCVVDVLGRAGRIHTLLQVIEQMPFHPGIVAWHTMLGACRKWGNVELGRLAFEHISHLDKEVATAYVSMYNIYADAELIQCP